MGYGGWSFDQLKIEMDGRKKKKRKRFINIIKY